MYDPYVILELPGTATKEEAKAAYRRLASKFHPDKFELSSDKIAAEEQFKKIKSAWEAIDNGWVRPIVSQPQSAQWVPPRPSTSWRANYSHPTKIDSSVVVAYRELEEFRKYSADFVARPSISQGFHGFTLLIPTETKQYKISIPPGVPSGIRLQISIGQHVATICILFTQSQYKFVPLHDAKKEQILYGGEPAFVYRTKDLYTAHELDSKKIRNGTSFNLIDIAGQSFSVKVPREHDCRKFIEIPNHGYFDWITSHSIADTRRGSVFVKIISTEKVEMSHNL